MRGFPSALASAALAAAVLLARGAGSPDVGACGAAGACGAVVEETEEHALLATSAVRRHGSARDERQRSDDPVGLVPVPAPAPLNPPPLLQSAPLPTPKPAPNPVDNPLINGYTGENCTVETWPFFADVVGSWEGAQGQNFIALPQANAQPEGRAFLVQINRYSEILDFEPTGAVLNRGYERGVQIPPVSQSDQVFTGVLYTQVVQDLDLDMTIHKESGFFLHQSCLPVNAFLADDWQVSRMGTIPHGSQPMGFGGMTIVHTPSAGYYVQQLVQLRATFEFSVMPFVPGCGPQIDQQRTPGNNTGPFAEATGPSCCIGGRGYMEGTDQCPNTGCPEPIDELIDAVRGLNITRYVQLNLTTADTIGPRLPVGEWFPGIRGGGVQNTAFVNINAMSVTESFRNMVWLLTVQDGDSTYELIQYIQTVNIKFLAKAAGCPDQLWPHVDANTLRRAKPSPVTPTPAPTPTEPGNCYNVLCGGCRQFTEPWASRSRCSLGPWCSMSQDHCRQCNGRFCPKTRN